MAIKKLFSVDSAKIWRPWKHLESMEASCDYIVSFGTSLAKFCQLGAENNRVRHTDRKTLCTFMYRCGGSESFTSTTIFKKHGGKELARGGRDATS